MQEAINAIFMILEPILDFFETLLRGFYRTDLLIFGVPYYRWVILLFVLSSLLGIVLRIWEDKK